MSYVGGKAKAHFIIDILNHPAFDGMDFYEPFVGYAHILRRVERKRSYTASDSHPLLITLLQSLHRGDPMPGHISRQKYDQLRLSGENSLEASVACFAYSFNGKAWGGYSPTYTRRSGRVDDQAGSRLKYYKLLQNSSSFKASIITLSDYKDHTPTNSLVYCDPPYRNTQGYKGTSFDSDEFWQTATKWSLEGNIVLVSEYVAPHDWVCVAQAPKQATLAGGHKQTPRHEKLYVHASRLPHPALSPV